MAVQYLLIALGALVLGYIVGRLDALHTRLNKLERPEPPLFELNKPRKWLTQDTPAAKTPIAIDTSKFVTEVSTAGLEKPEDLALGEKKTVKDDISASVNKLAQLKRS